MLHGFLTGHRKGTTSLEANLLQQLMATRVAVIHAIFLEIQKAYVPLDRDRCLKIL